MRFDTAPQKIDVHPSNLGLRWWLGGRDRTSVGVCIETSVSTDRETYVRDKHDHQHGVEPFVSEGWAGRRTVEKGGKTALALMRNDIFTDPF